MLASGHYEHGRRRNAMSLVIRPCLDSYSGEVAVISAHHVTAGLASFELAPPSAAEMALRRKEVLARGLPYFVAELDGVVAGYSYANAYRARPAYRFTVEDSIYVRRDYAGRGVGAALLPALIDACTQADCRQMLAVIGDRANAASIGLHQRFGFAHVGLLPAVGFKFGRWVDSVLMQRALGAGDSRQP